MQRPVHAEVVPSGAARKRYSGVATVSGQYAAPGGFRPFGPSSFDRSVKSAAAKKEKEKEARARPGSSSGRLPAQLRAGGSVPVFGTIYGGQAYRLGRSPAKSRFMDWSAGWSAGAAPTKSRARARSEVDAAVVRNAIEFGAVAGADERLDFVEFRRLAELKVARSTRAEGAHTPRSEERFRRWFDGLDADANGTSRSELTRDIGIPARFEPKRWRTLFSYLGTISKLEFFAFSLREACTLHGSDAEHSSLSSFFAKYIDVDGAGHFSKGDFDEITARLGFGGIADELLADAEVDEEGNVTSEEVHPFDSCPNSP
jgi:hypothetical protein